MVEAKQEATVLSASEVPNTLNLPDEIWSKVFSYLLVKDRKSIRLTCHRFYDVANCVIVQKTEEMVFNGSINTDAAILSFSNSQRKVWNIKLNQVFLADVSILPFFENQGLNVRSLIFDNCRIAPGLLKNIIEYCENLEHFALLFRPKIIDLALGIIPYIPPSSIGWNELGIIFSDFAALRENGIILQNVTNFTLHIDDYLISQQSLTNERFLNLFDVFPSIKELDLVFSEPIEKNSLSYSCLCDQLQKMCHQLERLNLFHKCDDFSCSLKMLNVIPSTEIEKFKKLSLNCSCFQDTSAVNTFPQFRYLSDFKCSLPDTIRTTISLSAFVELILNTAIELRDLTLTLPLSRFDTDLATFDMERSCLQTLLRSGLETFCVNMSKYVIKFPVFPSGEGLRPNYVLKKFFFDTKKLDGNDSTLRFSKFFHSLEILIVEKFSVDTLENIFRYQANLRYLELYNCYHQSTPRTYRVSLASLQEWLSSINLLNRRLDHLTHLLLAEDVSLDLSEFLLREFVFPKLQSLVIMLRSYNTERDYRVNESLWQSIQNLTELEFLEIRGEIEVPFSRWFALCSSLSKLRYFLIFSRTFPRLDDLEYQKLFQIRPSLSIIFHGHDLFNNLCVKYFKDIMTNIVKNVPPPSFIFFSTRQFIYEGIPPKYYKDCYKVSRWFHKPSNDLFYT